MPRFRLGPHERNAVTGAFDSPPAGTDFHHQQPAGIEMSAGFPEDPAHEVETVLSARERDARLVAVFPRQAAHAVGSDVWRIADDQIVTPAFERAEKVGCDEPHAPGEVVAADVAPRDGQRRARDVRGVHARPGKTPRKEDGKAAGPGAQVKRRFDGAGIPDPGREALAQQLRDMRARHDHALVHVESVLSQPRFAHKVRGRFAFRDATLDELQGGGSLGWGRSDARSQAIRCHLQDARDQEGCLLRAARGAVAVHEARGGKAPCAVAHEFGDILETERGANPGRPD